MDHVQVAKNIAYVLTKTRADSNVSQEEMALELGVSRQTIANFEKGISQPNIGQLLNWFEVTGDNPLRPVLAFLYPSLYKEILPKDEKVKEGLVTYLESLPTNTQQQISYVFLGVHGSSPISLIQLFCAYLHLPLEYRIIIARTILETYELCENNNHLVCPDNIKPDVKLLDNSINSCKKSVLEQLKGYSSI